MNLTLHLTEKCNMDCVYCIREKKPRDMSEDVLRAACDLIFSQGKAAGFSFFGGEPLLKKDLIYLALDLCRAKEQETGKKFRCRMTTNGLLLDDEFLQRAAAVNMGIGLSFDGLIQHESRRLAGGADSFEAVVNAAKRLLAVLPNSYAMMTIPPQAAGRVYESVRFVLDLGFRRITLTPAYGRRVTWTDESMDALFAQLELVADDMVARFREHKYVFFSPICGKINDLRSGTNPANRCHLGFRQMPVAPDGKLYACTQFIGDADYELGDVFHGLDREKQLHVLEMGQKRQEPPECLLCDLRERCTHTCGCTNRMETGHEAEVSATTCTYERRLIELADRTGERMYEADSGYFDICFPSR